MHHPCDIKLQYYTITFLNLVLQYTIMAIYSVGRFAVGSSVFICRASLIRDRRLHCDWASPLYRLDPLSSRTLQGFVQSILHTVR
jgi:hypothetical protein